jgi:SAM-dependent methyltransferase
LLRLSIPLFSKPFAARHAAARCADHLAISVISSAGTFSVASRSRKKNETVGDRPAAHSDLMSSSQRWDPALYDRHARFVSDLAGPVLELLDARPGEEILDLGCGDGVLTAALAARGCHTLGADSSPALIEATRARGVPALVVESQSLASHPELDGRFHAVFSNAALHWMRPPEPVIAGVHRVLRPGGRFVAEMGGAGCVATVRRGLAQALARRGLEERALCPWYFPSDAEYRALLEAAGFQVESMVLVPRPTALPGSVRSWLELFAQSYTAAVADPERFLAEAEEDLRPLLCDPSGRWTADYVRLRFGARKPG